MKKSSYIKQFFQRMLIIPTTRKKRNLTQSLENGISRGDNNLDLVKIFQLARCSEKMQLNVINSSK